MEATAALQDLALEISPGDGADGAQPRLDRLRELQASAEPAAAG